MNAPVDLDDLEAISQELKVFGPLRELGNRDAGVLEEARHGRVERDLVV